MIALPTPFLLPALGCLKVLFKSSCQPWPHFKFSMHDQKPDREGVVTKKPHPTITRHFSVVA